MFLLSNHIYWGLFGRLRGPSSCSALPPPHVCSPLLVSYKGPVCLSVCTQLSTVVLVWCSQWKWLYQWMPWSRISCFILAPEKGNKTNVSERRRGRISHRSENDSRMMNWNGFGTNCPRHFSVATEDINENRTPRIKPRNIRAKGWDTEIAYVDVAAFLSAIFSGHFTTPCVRLHTTSSDRKLNSVAGFLSSSFLCRYIRHASVIELPQTRLKVKETIP